MNGLLWLIPALPLLGATVLGVAAPKPGTAGLIGASSVGLAALLACAIGLAWLHQPPQNHAFIQPLWSWIALPGLSAGVTLYLDPVSLLMILVITVIGFLIHVFSTEYMAGEAGYSRYFAYLNLFVAAMLLLVLASDLLVLFIGWEGVGVCSYLLVGFWFGDARNGLAAQKSFIVTRIADIAMLAGLLLLSVKFGTLEIQPMLAAAAKAWPQGGAWPDVAAALLLIGGLGKSAQVPLHTWLPDAMAGPTPVSALIHAATMVTAGVYLVVRTHALFLLAPEVLHAIAIGAAATILIAACAGLVQSDVKRVLAYSTMSQIGYMFLALGVGAWSAAMFHLLTHAVFKALLFLSAGAITMRLHHEQDIFAMGGLGRKLPIGFAAFLIGGASLAAMPIVSCGFFSKEMILGAVFQASPGLWAAGLLGAVLTATYVFRAVFLVFLGPQNTEISGTSGMRVRVPLVLLGLAALTIGWVETPDFLGGANGFAMMLAPATGPLATPARHPLIALAGIGAPFVGIAVAYGLYRSGFWRRHAAGRANYLTRVLQSGFGFDAAYDVLLTRPFLWLVKLLRHDPVDFCALALEELGGSAHRRLRALQGGRLRRYAGWLMAGSVAMIAALLFA